MCNQSPVSVNRCTIVIFLLICSASLCYSSTVDIHPGQNIPDIVAQNPAGTTFIIYPGTYRLTAHIVPKNGDSFIGETSCAPPQNTCPAILTGSKVIGSLAKFNGTNYEVTGQTQQGRVTQPTKVCEPGYLACNRPEDLFFDGVPYQHLYAASMPAIGSGQWWFDYTNHVIYFHNNPAGHTVETSVLDTAFFSSANNVTLQYLTITGFASPLQEAGVEPTNGNLTRSSSANWQIKNCEIYNNHGAGVRVGYEIGIHNSYIHTNAIVGIIGGTQSTSASGIVVEGNTINSNNFAKALPSWGAGGFKVGQTSGVVVRGNTISMNDGDGIHFDTSSENVLVDGNMLVQNTGGAGIAYEISLSSALIRNNVVLKDGLSDGVSISTAGVGTYDSSGVTAYCNVIEVPSVKGTSGLMIVASNRGYNVISPFQYLTATGNTFHHNTVFWDSGATGMVGFQQGDVAHQPNFFINNPAPDYNSYHLRSMSDANFMYDNNLSGENDRKTFTEYQAAGADIHGSADTNVNNGYPTVKITSPLDQTSFKGSTTVQATASDKSGINRVAFYVDIGSAVQFRPDWHKRGNAHSDGRRL
jgi:parallel beta-helix repeat protein